MKEEARILVVEDDSDVIELLQHKLTQSGFQVMAVSNPLTTFSIAKQFRPHLFLLDIMMPELNGLQICRVLRADPQYTNVPIVFLTAKTDIKDRIKGLSAGADDYITKPFVIKEVILRLQAILSRSHSLGSAQNGKNTLQIGAIKMDIMLYTVTVNDEPVHLTYTEFKLLRLLMEREGRTLSRENLITNVWGYNSDSSTRAIDTHIRRLRDKLGSSAYQVATVRGVGYRINAN